MRFFASHPSPRKSEGWEPGTTMGVAIGMKEWMKVFLAMAAIVSGLIFVLTAERNYALYDWQAYAIGVVLIAGGATYFWTTSRFCKK
jgi:lipoprotein signal peptidase